MNNQELPGYRLHRALPLNIQNVRDRTVSERITRNRQDVEFEERSKSFDDSGLDELNDIINHSFYLGEQTPTVLKQHLSFGETTSQDSVFSFEAIEVEHNNNNAKLKPVWSRMSPQPTCSQRMASHPTCSQGMSSQRMHGQKDSPQKRYDQRISPQKSQDQKVKIKASPALSLKQKEALERRSLAEGLEIVNESKKRDTKNNSSVWEDVLCLLDRSKRDAKKESSSSTDSTASTKCATSHFVGRGS
ncbi:unnamed protein product [Bursaphelenchus okinawaensis]|uniref:Uncharacterized protein n=1 Tax=Bursaphelenchus okinawaensis TaxID=465554 RepID=A0A811JRA2_9BILA|nr:unnamed protein product [Bursaphelenchus okinawaensis]CAG9079911.1 unnamed protein product [Bursaphelenchus okinawaensis]